MVNKEKTDDPPEGLAQIPKLPTPDPSQALESFFENNPKFIRVLNRYIMRESLQTAIFLTFLFAGAMSLINAFKTLFNAGVTFDILFGCASVFIGSLWVIRKMKKK